MGVSDVLLDVVDRRVARAVSRGRSTAHAKVTSVNPLTVTFDGDVAAVPMRAAAGLLCDVGDTVGLTRFGSRWYVTDVLKESS